MRYGDEVVATEDGIKIRPKALAPIGVFPESECWGLWVQSLEANKHNNPPHLLISPIHPDSWPIMIRLILKIADQPGTLAKAASYVADKLRLNVLFAECSPSGHSHATWNALCEVVPLKKKSMRDAINKMREDVQTALRSNDSATNKNNALKTIKKATDPLAACLFQFITYAKRELNEPSPTNPGHAFIHTRLLEEDTLFYALNEDRILPTCHATQSYWEQLGLNAQLPENERVYEESKRQRAFPCDAFVTANLAFNWFVGKSERPIRFIYDSQQCIMKPADSKAFNDYKEHRQISFPRPTTVTFDTREQYLRLAFDNIPSKYRASFRLDYDVEFNSNTGDAPASTMGYLASLAEKLNNSGLNLRRVANKTTGRTLETEKGTIEFVATANEDLGEKFEGLEKALEGVLFNKTIQDTSGSVRRARAERGGIYSVFTIMRLKWTLEEQFWRDAVPAARKLGFELERNKGRPGNIAANSLQLIKQCQYCIAVLPFLDAEERSCNKRPELGWQLYEIGLATALNKPPISLVEVESAKRDRCLDHWKSVLQVEQANMLFPFDPLAATGFPEGAMRELGNVLGLLLSSP